MAMVVSVAAAGRAQSITELAKLTASDPENGDEFGYSVALDGDTALVGARFAGVGTAYVFQRSHPGSITWNEVACLSAGTGGFGWSVAIEGDTAVVGARFDDHSGLTNPGSTYVFERAQGGPNAWGQVAWLTAAVPGSLAGFGNSVAISGDTIVVGEFQDDNAGGGEAGAAHVFERDLGGAGAWGLCRELTASDGAEDDWFGYEVALRDDTIVVTAAADDTGFDVDNVEGLAFDPATATLYGTDTTNDDLVTIDALTGAATPIGALGFDNVEGLAFDSSTDTLFGTDVTTDQLIAIDTGTGAGAAVGPLGFGRVSGLAFDPLTATLYGTDIPTDQLITIDRQTGSGTPVGSLGFAGLRGLTFDPATGTLYGSDNGTDQLVTIDTATGRATPIGPTGFNQVFGLAWDPLGTKLFGVDDLNSDQLLSLDTATGTASAIGSLWTFQNDAGSAYVYERDAGGPGEWGEVRKLTAGNSAPAAWFGLSAAMTPDTLVVGAPQAGFAGVNSGSAYVFERHQGGPGAWGQVAHLLPADVEADDFFGSGVSIDGDALVVGARRQDLLAMDVGAVYVFERDRGGPNAWGETLKLVSSDGESDDQLGDSVAILGDTVLSGAPRDDAEVATHAGSVYFFSRTQPHEPYCTAGISASGCEASLSIAGFASASAAGGFTLMASTVEGQKDGLLFFGTSGRQANPWGTGTSYQCVVPPVTRAGLLTGAGTSGLCDGSFSQDLNALWCPTCPQPQKNPGAGAVVQAQLWYRDPLNTSNQTTSLSDAIEFLVGS